jgi:hypothetical protein
MCPLWTRRIKNSHFWQLTSLPSYFFSILLLVPNMHGIARQGPLHCHEHKNSWLRQGGHSSGTWVWSRPISVGQNPALLASTLPGLNTAVLVMMNMVFIIIIWLNFVHVESFSVNGILEYIPIIFGKITFMDCRAVSSLYSKFYMQSSFMKIIFFFSFSSLSQHPNVGLWNFGLM